MQLCGNRPVMSLTEKAIGAGTWALAHNGGREIIALLLFLALARFFLSESDFGLAALANILVVFFLAFAKLGLNAALVQRGNLNDQHINAAFWTQAIAGLLITVTLILLAGSIADVLGEPKLEPVLEVVAVSIVVSSLGSTQEALLRRDMRFRPIAAMGLISITCGAVAAMVVAAAGGGVWSLVCLYLVSRTVGTIILWIANPWRPSIRFSFFHLRELSAIGVGAAGIAIVSIASLQLDQFIVGSSLGVAALGVYYVASRLVSAITKVGVTSIWSLALTSFTKVKDDRVRLHRGFQRALQYSGTVTFPALLGLMATSNEIVPVLFGDRWVAASGVLRWLCAAAILGSIATNVPSLLIAVGRPGRAFFLSLTGAVTMVLFGLIGATFGIEGVAIAHVARRAVMLLMWIVVTYATVALTLPMFIRPLVRPMVAAGSMVVAVLLFRYLTLELLSWPRLVVLVVEIIAGVVVWAAVLRVIEPEVFGRLLDQVKKIAPGQPLSS